MLRLRAPGERRSGGRAGDRAGAGRAGAGLAHGVRRVLDGHASIRTANVARNAVELWLDEAGPLEVRNSVREKVEAAWEAGRTEGRPDESR